MKLFMNNLISVNWETLNLFQNIITNDLPAAFFIFENASSYCSSFPASSDSVMSDPAFCPPGTSSADDA